MRSDKFTRLVEDLRADEPVDRVGFSAEGLRALPSLMPARLEEAPEAYRTVSPVTRRSLSDSALRLQDRARALPVAWKYKEIIECMTAHRVTVVTGDTGTGKTTQVPQMAFDYLWKHHDRTRVWLGQVLTAMPSKAATEAQFRRVCEETDVWPGKWAACRTHGCKQGDTKASLMFLTCGYLVRLLHTGILAKAAILIIDDTQDKTEDVSFLYAVLRQEFDLSRCTCKLVLMSAQGQVEEVREFFGDNVGHVSVMGRRFQLDRCEMSLLPRDVDADAEVVQRAVNQARQFMAVSNACILIFVKGVLEIDKVITSLEAPGWEVLPFHAGLAVDERTVIVDMPLHRRGLVIVSTNVAEAAVTIACIATVISTCRVNRTGKAGDLSTLTPAWCAQTEVNQQGGRTGRTFPGLHIICVPCASLPKERPAEIALDGDKRALAFELARMSTSLEDLAWMRGHRPPDAAFRKAQRALVTAGLLAHRDRGIMHLTEAGKQALGFSMVDALHFIQFILSCNDAGAGYEACAAGEYCLNVQRSLPYSKPGPG